MAPSEVFSDPIAELDYEQLEKSKLQEKYAKIKTGKYEPDDDDATEWDLNDLSKNSVTTLGDSKAPLDEQFGQGLTAVCCVQRKQ